MTPQLGYLAVIFSSVCFGFLGYFGKVGYQLGFTPLTLQIARFWLATLMLWLVALPRGLARYRVGRRELVSLAAQGVGYAMTALGYFSALRYLSASLVAIIFYIHPVITTLAAAGIFGERITRTKISALLLAVVGTALVSNPQALLSGSLSWMGLAWVMVSSCSYSAFTLLGQKTTAGRDPLMVTTYAMTFCGLFLALFHPPLYLIDGSMTLPMWGIALGISFICSVLAILFYIVGVSIIGASRTSIVAAAEPLSGLIVSAILLGERLGGWQWLGMALILLAVGVLQTNESKGQSATARRIPTARSRDAKD